MQVVSRNFALYQLKLFCFVIQKEMIYLSSVYFFSMSVHLEPIIVLSAKIICSRRGAAQQCNSIKKRSFDKLWTKERFMHPSPLTQFSKGKLFNYSLKIFKSCEDKRIYLVPKWPAQKMATSHAFCFIFEEITLKSNNLQFVAIFFDKF